MTATRTQASPDFDPVRDVSFLVISCDKYGDLWDPFFACMERYWPDCPFRVYLATNEAKYNRKGVSVINIGPDRDYASNMIAAIDAIPTPWVITWVEDGLFNGPIDSQRVLSLLKEAVAAGASYLKLTPDTPLSFNDANGERIGEVPKGVKYRSAMGACLYSKDLLRKLLVPGMSAWQMDQSNKADDLTERFMVLTVREARRPPLPALNGVIKGQWYWPVPAFLRREGFAHVLPGRRRQALKSYLYVQAYLFRLWMYRAVRKHWYA